MNLNANESENRNQNDLDLESGISSDVSLSLSLLGFHCLAASHSSRRARRRTIHTNGIARRRHSPPHSHLMCI